MWFDWLFLYWFSCQIWPFSLIFEKRFIANRFLKNWNSRTFRPPFQNDFATNVTDVLFWLVEGFGSVNPAKRHSNEETPNFKARQNRVRRFENLFMSYFQATRPRCKIESYYTTWTQKKNDCFSVDGYYNHCKTVFEAMGCYFHFWPCQGARPSITDDELKRGAKNRKTNELQKNYIPEKGYSIEEMFSVFGGGSI